MELKGTNATALKGLTIAIFAAKTIHMTYEINIELTANHIKALVIATDAFGGGCYTEGQQYVADLENLGLVNVWKREASGKWYYTLTDAGRELI